MPHTATKSKSSLPIILITGLSGSGKSSIISALEDISFFVIQGIPIKLIPRIITAILHTLPETVQGIAIHVQPTADIRLFHEDMHKLRGQLQELGTNPIVLFVEASIATLVQRYVQTRRPHPREYLGFSLEQAIQEELELRTIREYADILIDTTNHTIHTLRNYIQKEWYTAIEMEKDLLRIQIITFGFKYGIPKDADMVFDVRFLPNPYFIDELREFSGLDQCIQDYVFSHDVANITFASIIHYIETILPFYHNGGWRRVSIAIGCTGGKHRSVSFAMKIAKILQQRECRVDIEHRNITL